MLRYVLRRLAIIPFALILIHFLGFSYAYVARPIRASRTPYLREQVQNPLPLLETYQQNIEDILNGSLLEPLENGPQITSFAQELWQALIASVGLLLISLVVSIIGGMVIGLTAVRDDPPGVRGWLTPLSTIGLAMPSFYIASLSILGIVYFVMARGSMTESPVPLRGFGWDIHLLLPVLALSLRPTVQIAQVIASFLAAELGKQYIVAARSFGHTWRDIRWRQAMRNILAALILSIASTFRLLMGELVVVEWMFNWPGLGRMLAMTLVPGHSSSSLGATNYFLEPAIVALDIAIFATLFLGVELLASMLVRIVDPRLRAQDEQALAGEV